MNIKQAIKLAKINGGTLVGFHTIPVPVYQVVLNYETIDDNPFFPIQKAILQYVDKFASLEEKIGVYKFLQSLAAALGLDLPLIKTVYDELKGDDVHLIYRDSETQLLCVQDSARNKYLMDGSRPLKKVTGSIVVDGKSFSLFPKEVYEEMLDDSIFPVTRQNYDAVPHLPLDISQADTRPEFVNLVSALNSHKYPLKILGLEHSDGNKFEIMGIEEKYLPEVYLLYVVGSDNSVKKIPYINNVVLDVSALKAKVKYCTFALRGSKNGICLTANLGYNCNELSPMKIVEEVDSDKRWYQLISRFYNVPEEYTKDSVISDSYGLKSIFVTEKFLVNSTDPIKILKGCLEDNSQVCIPLSNQKGNVRKEESGCLLLRISYEDKIHIYIEIYKLLQEQLSPLELEEKLVRLASDNWRYYMIKMKQYSRLEEIDCSRYIHPLQ